MTVSRKILFALASIATVAGLAFALTRLDGDTLEADKPKALTMTEDAIGHYCRMALMPHNGPKAQIHLAGQPEPLWFAQVRDSIAYRKSPEQSHRMLAHYVNDIGAAPSWTDPGADNWIEAEAAYFVAHSSAIGGMGAPELVPFAELQQAEAFAKLRGGTVLRLADIPQALVLAPVASHSAPAAHSGH